MRAVLAGFLFLMFTIWGSHLCVTNVLNTEQLIQHISYFRLFTSFWHLGLCFDLWQRCLNYKIYSCYPNAILICHHLVQCCSQCTALELSYHHHPFIMNHIFGDGMGIFQMNAEQVVGYPHDATLRKKQTQTHTSHYKTCSMVLVTFSCLRYWSVLIVSFVTQRWH